MSLSICQWISQLRVVVSYSLLWVGLISSSPILITMICPSLGYKSMVLHILTWTPQLILLLTIHPAIGSKILLPWSLLHRPLCSISWRYLLLYWFHDPIFIVLVVFQIFSCWTNVWKVKCTLKGLLDLSDPVPF